MAAWVESTERVSSQIDDTPVEVALTKNQTVGNCWVRVTARHGAGQNNNTRQNNFARVEVFDDLGTPTVRINRTPDFTYRTLFAEVEVIEVDPAEARVQSGFFSLDDGIAQDDITIPLAIVPGKSFAALSFNIPDWDSAVWRNVCLRAKFIDANTLRVYRQGSDGTLEIQWQVIESLNDAFSTQYVEFSHSSSSSGSTHTITSGDATKRFVVMSYDSDCPDDDLRDIASNVAIVGATTLEWFRNHNGTRAASGNVGAWVVTAGSDEHEVQRIAHHQINVASENIPITPIDTSRSVAFSSGMVSGGAWSISSTNNGQRVEDWQTRIWCSTSVCTVNKRTATEVDGGANAIIRAEVISFKLPSPVTGRIMSSLVGAGGLAASGGIAGAGGGLAA